MGNSCAAPSQEDSMQNWLMAQFCGAGAVLIPCGNHLDPKPNDLIRALLNLVKIAHGPPGTQLAEGQSSTALHRALGGVQITCASQFTIAGAMLRLTLSEV
jgi:hypothetical protein